ncbi:hypothetical protein [Mycobacterium sp.]|uniref:hypothetical protein n=1 Tax=Mycobacterium sp. TaxID=1785 RepID=UPI0025E8EFE3|nr:hypothetical protein [Mycobacterium sp.]MBW0014763.1 hypothetical protein [Mycobacterium sp.]
MNGSHPDIGPELRKLAQAILDGIEPAVRAAAVLTAGGGVGTGKCQQVWCPVCALAALATGDQHPLLTVIADHSVALLDLIRGMVSDIGDGGDNRDGGDVPDTSDGNHDGDPPGGGVTTEPCAGPTAREPGAKTRYQPIPVTVED